MLFQRNTLWSRGVLLLALSLPLMQGCAREENAAVMTAVEDKAFNDWSNNVIKQIEADPKYKRIPIDTTEESADFIVLMHDAFRKKISHKMFFQRVNARYPDHQYEISFIVSRLP